MRNRLAKYSILDSIDPLHTFLFVVTVALVLILASLPVQTTPTGLEPIEVDAAGGCKQPGHNDGCSDITDCCLKWIPASDPDCDDPGPGGGCCVSYGEQCNDPVLPPPPSPPTISGTLTCAQLGNNGWCIDSLNLNLTASDPQGQTVIISGNINGTAFACPSGATSCTVPITTDGTGTASYTVHSATGLSASGSKTYQLDATTPQIDGSVTGASGLKGWYVSAVTVSASAGDSTSGTASFEYSLDGSPWTSYSSALVLSDGLHTLNFRAMDAAGNQSETSQAFSIDTITPTLDLSVTGRAGSNGWYRSDVQVAASANDAGSGISAFEYSLDGGTWITYGGPLTLTDGAHSLSVRVMDAAGNVTQTDQGINVDSITPSIDLSTVGTRGANGWYVSNISVTASASDPGSGLASVEYSLNDGAWTPYTNALSYLEGRYSLRFRVIDVAGNITTTPAQTYSLDTTPPLIELPASVELGQLIEYSVQDSLSGMSTLRVVIEDDAERWPKIAWDEYPHGASRTGDFLWDGKFRDGTKAPAGTYYATIKASDQAGNESSKTVSIAVQDDIWEQFIPSFVPPAQTPEPTVEPPSTDITTTFGGENSGETGEEQVGTLTTGGGNNSVQPDDPNSTSFSTTSTSRTNDTEAGGILWGAIAAAAVGTFVAETEEKKRREQAVQQSKNDSDQALKRQLQTARRNGDKELIKELEFRIAERQRENTGGNETEYDKKVRARKLSELEEQWAAEKAEAAQRQYNEWLRTGKNPPPGLDFADITAEERLTMYMQTPLYQARLQAQKEKEAEEQRYQNWLRTGKNPPPGFEDVTTEERLALYKATPEYQARREAEIKADAERAYQEYLAGEKERTAESTEPAEPNAWENTKSFIWNHIVQPFNENLYQPYIQPVVEATTNVIAEKSSWVNEHIYQPYIQPLIEARVETAKRNIEWLNEHFYQPVLKPFGQSVAEKVTQVSAWVNDHILQPAVEWTVDKVTTGVAWANEHVYQPYVKPWAGEQIESLKDGISWVNEKIYQPYLQPGLAAINENVIQPYVQPLLDQAAAEVKKTASWVDENIYQSFLLPAVADLNKYIVQPYVTPIAEKASAWWDQYGEWVHGALDFAGFIPGLGEIADGLNGLVYLAEGRYLEASLSVVAMLPLLGDLGKAGKWAVNTAETVVDKVVKEVAGEAIEKTAKELLEEGAERAAKDSVEWMHTVLDAAGCIPDMGAITTKANTLLYLAEGRILDATISAISMVPVVGDLTQFGKLIVENSFQRLVKEASEEIREQALKEASEAVAKEISEEITEGIIKEAGETLVTKSVKETTQELAETVAKESLEEIAEKTVKEAGEEVIEKTAKETLEEGAEKVLKEVGEEAAEKTTKEILQETAEKTAKRVQRELKEDALIERVTGEDPDTVPVEGTREHHDETQANTPLKDKYDNLVNKHGDRAVEALGNLNPENANKLLSTLDEDVLDRAIQQGPDAVEALSLWDERDLIEHSDELVLRAKNDAQVLADVRTLVASGPIDPNNLTVEQRALIERIAANSTQYPDGWQVVLGKWVNQSSGFVERARDSASVHYNPHPEMWKLLEPLGPANQGEVAWLINKQVVQTGMSNGLNFEYTLNGIAPSSVTNEGVAVEAIFADAPDTEIMDILKADNMPIRMRELKELQQAGYQYVFDEVTNSYIIKSP